MQPETSGVKQETTPVKKKIVIQERQYTDQLIDCAQSAVWLGFGSFFIGAFSVPYIIRKLRFIPSTRELRLTVGVISGFVIGQNTIKYAKENCQNKLAETYDYIPYEL